MEINIEVVKFCKNWQKHKRINKTLIKKVTLYTLQLFQNFSNLAQAELSILLTDDSNMKDLNSQFRDKEKSTNVLSFPSEERKWQDLRLNKFSDSNSPSLEILSKVDYIYLGDIAFSYETIYNEAYNQKKLFEDHFTHLLIHSILHLIGFDHQNNKEANFMENLEIKILEHFGIVTPY